MEGVCDQHGVASNKLEEVLTQLAVVVSQLDDMRATKALNCEARIRQLEKNSTDCLTLRVGPRVDTVETRLDKLLWGGLTVAAVNIFGILFIVFKIGLKG